MIEIKVPPIWEMFLFAIMGYLMPDQIFYIILFCIIAIFGDPYLAKILGKRNRIGKLLLIPDTYVNSFYVNGSILFAYCVGVILKSVMVTL